LVFLRRRKKAPSKGGVVIVEFTIDNTGHAVWPRAVEAAELGFGEALMADIEANKFIPPRLNAKATTILTELRNPNPWIFDADRLDATVVAKTTLARGAFFCGDRIVFPAKRWWSFM
jgi:hypothetical protein